MRKKGFSIAEVIISLFVITVGLIAILGLIASSIRESAGSRNQIIGAQLAQEGFELVRNVRDNNVINGELYNEGLSNNNNACADYLTTTAGTPNFGCTTGNRLYYNSDPNVLKYRHNNGYDATPFSRKIDISNPAAGEIGVRSKAWWGLSEPTDATCNSANKCVLVRNSLTEHPQ